MIGLMIKGEIIIFAKKSKKAKSLLFFQGGIQHNDIKGDVENKFALIRGNEISNDKTCKEI